MQINLSLDELEHLELAVGRAEYATSRVQSRAAKRGDTVEAAELEKEGALLRGLYEKLRVAVSQARKTVVVAAHIIDDGPI